MTQPTVRRRRRSQIALVLATLVIVAFGQSASAAPTAQLFKNWSWSGYSAESSGASAVNFRVMARFKVPRLDCNATPDAAATIWAGIGDTPAGALAQAGAWLNCTSGKYSGYLFWETIPGDKPHFTGRHNNTAYPVNAGDEVWVSVCPGGYYPEYPNGDIPIEDGGCYGSVGDTRASSDFHMSSWIVRPNQAPIQFIRQEHVSVPIKPRSAECIVERVQPQKGVKQPPIAKFASPYTFDDCQIIQDVDNTSGSQIVDLASPRSGITVTRLETWRTIVLFGQQWYTKQLVAVTPAKSTTDDQRSVHNSFAATWTGF